MAVNVDALNPDFRARLLALVRASGGKVGIGSGFRSHDEQARLYKEKPQLAAPPGHSNHERGMAADLTGDLELAHQLAPQFGLTFPMWGPANKSGKKEPWHVEPVGAGHLPGMAAYAAAPPGQAAPQQAPPTAPEGPDLHRLDVQLGNLLDLLATDPADTQQNEVA